MWLGLADLHVSQVITDCEVLFVSWIPSESRDLHISERDFLHLEGGKF